jgi:hypothetical protein
VSRAALCAVAATVVVLAASCDEGGPSGAGGRDAEGSAMSSVPLRPGEAPRGLRLDPEGTGPVGSLGEILPPRTRFPNLRPVPARIKEAFRDGFERAFVDPDGEGAATSSAVRFADPLSAAVFLTYLRELPVGGNASAAEDVPVAGLGEEGYGWHVEVPESESSGFGWRSGDLVLTLSLAGSLGEAGPETALELAERIDGRLG